MGRNIRTLMNVNQNAGYHSIQWDAKNDIGEGVRERERDILHILQLECIFM